MRRFLLGKPGGLCAFLVIAALVAGGLGGATAAALRLEREQAEARADKEYLQNLHLALWRLDNRFSPVLAREGNRPYSHYSAVYAPSVVLRSNLTAWPHGNVLAPSPLLSVDLYDWMLLHVQADDESGWESPQVLGGAQRRRLSNPASHVVLTNVTDNRRLLLDDLQKTFLPAAIFDAVRARGTAFAVRETTVFPPDAVWDGANNSNFNNDPPTQVPNFGQAGGQPPGRSEGQTRFAKQQQAAQEANPTSQKEPSQAVVETLRRQSGANWLTAPGEAVCRGEEVGVHLSPLAPVWLTRGDDEPLLLWARLVRIEDKELCQGVVLDWPKLRQQLVAEVEDLFPDATFEPVLPGTTADPERTMSTLLVQLVPAERAAPRVPLGTPLRLGLAAAWAAALVALAAVGLGGWALLDLSQRRIRFVSAVTHELRTPLTTLRLYLDMLTGGLVKEEKQKEEYLHTLNAEADRLNRLVGNVLDFSRLENQRPRLQTTTTTVAALVAEVVSAWGQRCHDSGKELIVDPGAAPDADVRTDVTLVQQVVANLLDNACKYSRGAEDRRLWLRAMATDGRLILEVEDRGPGVPLPERRSIFQPFRRGRGAETVGGVGLGLALAGRWARLLGGRLTLCATGAGACFRLELPRGGTNATSFGGTEE